MDLRLQLNSGSCLVKVTHIYTNSKTLKRRRECVFRGKVKKTQITVCEKLIKFNSVKRGRSQCIEKKIGLSVMACIASLPVNAKWQQT